MTTIIEGLKFIATATNKYRITRSHNVLIIIFTLLSVLSAMIPKNIVNKIGRVSDILTIEIAKLLSLISVT